MLHTMGYKEAIVNNPATLPITIPATGKINIKGFGTFDKDMVVSATGQRFIAEQFATLTFDVPTTASMGLVTGDVNKSVVVHIRVNTSRHSSEYATDYIKRGRPLIFELVVNYADTQAQVAAKLVAAFAAYVTKFNLSAGLPFTYASNSNTITLTAKAGHLSFRPQVTFLLAGQTYGSTVTGATASEIVAATLTTGEGLDDITAGGTYTGRTLSYFEVKVVADGATDPNTFVWRKDGGDWSDATDMALTATALSDGVTVLWDAVTGHTADDVWTIYAYPATLAGAEPTVDGKYLEENVRMSKPETDGAYSIHPDERPIISASYTTIKFRMKTTESAGVAETFAPHDKMGEGVGNISTDAYTDYIIYLDEAQNIASGGSIDKLVTFFGTTAGLGFNYFYLSSGTAATNVAKFLADSNA